MLEVILPRSNALNDVPADFEKSHHLEEILFADSQ